MPIAATGGFGPWLVLLAIGYPVTHHIGTLFAGLGDVGSTDTRWADWIDLITPYVVTGRSSRGAARGSSQPPHVDGLLVRAQCSTRRARASTWPPNSVGNAVRDSPRTSGTSTSGTTLVHRVCL